MYKSRNSGDHLPRAKPFLVPFVFVLLVLLVVGTVMALASNGTFFNRGYREYRFNWFLMDTNVNVIIYSKDGQKTVEAAAGKAFDEMKGLEELLSRGVEGSDVWLINEGAGSPVQVSGATLSLVQDAVHYGRISGGAFDVTIAPLMNIWGFFDQESRLPSGEEIDSALPLVDYRNLHVDVEKSEVALLKPGMELDPGGIAKGLIVDKGMEVLQREGIEKAIINAGGDIRVLGDKPGGLPWRIGVRNPRDNGAKESMVVLPLVDTAVATSGDYERFFVQDGIRYHHIIDPHTGYPAAGLTSVTVTAPDTVTADALSTAVFIMGPEKGMELVESLPGIEAILVGPHQEIIFSSGLRHLD